jgi:DNA repair exonuclease SbcCD ATPase subunit
MSEKEASLVLTSENSGDFYANKLGLAEETPTEAIVPVEPQTSEPEAKEEPKATEEQKPNKLEKRFSDITKQREQARQEAERERLRASELEARLKDLESQLKPKQVDDGKPRPEQYSDAFEYNEALTEYKINQRIQQIAKEAEQAKQQEERLKQAQTFAEREQAVRAELADYDEMIASSDVMISDQVKDAILESEIGPRIIYHLAENPEIAEKINKLSLVNALKEVGKIEARLEKAPESKAEVKAVVVSKAPKPISPLKSMSASAEVPIDSSGNFNGSFKQYREMRKQGKIR